MSIIQDIRDKYAKVAVVAIALALIGFILTDYFKGNNRGGRVGGSKTVGSVNGSSINADEFGKKVTQAEANMRQPGYPAAMVTAQAVDNVWNQEVNSMLLNDEIDKLGMKIGKKELGDILYGPNMPSDLKQQLTDENGVYDPATAMRKINDMLKSKTVAQEQKDGFRTYVEQLKEQRLGEKYVALLSNSSNFPRWYLEKQNADNSLIGKISVVREFYTAIVDSTVKVTDKEIADYISKHKDLFKQEESRNIAFVAFNAAPTAADSAKVKSQLLALKAGFDSTKNMAQFLSGEGVTDYSDTYKPSNAIQIPVKDSIVRLPVGSIYGPYVKGNNYVLAKLEGAKQVPDSVTVRHILIATTQTNPQTGQAMQIRDTATAYRLCDSIRKEIAKGANFDSLCAKFSDDGTKDKGGIYENVYFGRMVPEFNDFIFFKGPGSKDIVKTDFGYHYIENLSSKGSGMAYKIAELSKEIAASDETQDSAQAAAFRFAGNSPDQKAFDAEFEKTLKPKGYTKGVAPDIKPSDAQVQNIGFSRTFVRSVYDVKLGEVLKPEKINDNYIVAVVTAVLEEGTKSVVTARPEVEAVLINKKKAAALKQKVGKVTTLEAAATALGGKPIEVVDSVRLNSTAKLQQYEPMVSGATFNPSNKGKVVPEVLEGINGIYIIRVDSTGTTPVANGDIAEQRKGLYQQFKNYISNPQGPGYPLNALRNAAVIKDKRSNRY